LLPQLFLASLYFCNGTSLVTLCCANLWLETITTCYGCPPDNNDKINDKIKDKIDDKINDKINDKVNDKINDKIHDKIDVTFPHWHMRYLNGELPNNVGVFFFSDRWIKVLLSDGHP
jgi:hypothetical protein